MVLQVVGQRVPRYDGRDHVTGATMFVDDYTAPDMLYVKALRSPVHKGKIKSLDVTDAQRSAGVKGVLTAKDLKVNIFGWGGDQPILVSENIRYQGELIAVVAATTPDAASEAVEKIKCDIQEETPVFDPIEAMKPGAPQVRAEGNMHMWGPRPYRQVVLGDVANAFEHADVIVEETYHHSSAKHAQIEPHASLAVPERSGKLTIYTSSQAVHFHLGNLCGLFGLPMNKIHLIGGTVGGGFGSKNDIHTDHVTGLLAMKTGYPVKWLWSREEDLLYSTFHGGWHMRYKDGVTKDGCIIAREIESVRESGAYLSLNPYVVDKHCFLSSGPYWIPNVSVKGYCILTNRPPASSMRGFGITPSNWAHEIQMDKVAEAIGMDKWEIRFRNAYRKGDMTATQRKLDSIAMVEVMQTLAAKAGVELPAHLKAMSSERGG
jgi:CO/xanthine dehydrogenase Mo-binding subunit